MAPHLPLEVITEILATLPVKSLLKYRLVCKSWCSLISSPQFVRKHLSSNISNPKRIIQLTPGQDLMFYSLHESIVVYESSKSLVRIENTNFHCINNKELDAFSIMGSCDGLVCVKAYPMSKIFLWNLSTKRIQNIAVYF
ncbi:hypothetical protein M0R45_014581 [Rubus argutus]|uniref:F-box domain-containing protein n=1 Tax=Rubus argutus TaxID=59490 RepID=A0AAW1XM07_RUBAR